MNANIDRDYLDARFQTVEERMDARIASIRAAIGALELRLENRMQHQDDRMNRQDERMDRQDERMDRQDQRMDRIESTISDIRTEIKSLKSTIIITGITAVVTIHLGMAAFNATIVSGMIAAFESGREVSAAQAEIKKQAEATAVLLRKAQEMIDARQAPERPIATEARPR